MFEQEVTEKTENLIDLSITSCDAQTHEILAEMKENPHKAAG
jgi:hypothetical protein